MLLRSSSPLFFTFKPQISVIFMTRRMVGARMMRMKSKSKGRRRRRIKGARKRRRRKDLRHQ